MMRRILCAVLAMVMVICLLPLNVIEAKAASAMKASGKVIQYLKSMEGFTAIPRWDYVQWTVGYGNRCPEEHLERYLKEGIPIEEADALFLEQLTGFEEQVNAFIDRNNLHFTQGQFDAVLSISYNLGPAWLTGNSDFQKAVVNGASGNTFIGLLSQLCTAGGEYLPGLMRRRLTEADMYLNGRYNHQAPENYCYVFFDAGEGKATAVAQGFDCNMYATPMVTATRSGYTFLGWYTAKEGGARITSLDENLHQMTLYAHWAEGDGQYSGDSTEMPNGVTVTVTGDIVNVRSGPGTTYPVINSAKRGDQIVITAVTTVNNRLWGKFEKGWICLDYTTYEAVSGDHGGSDLDWEDDSENYQAPVYATIVGTDVTLYNGPDASYPKVGTIKEGTEVLITETYKMFFTWWGHVEGQGWICLDRYVLLHNDQMLAHSFVATVTNSYLNVRTGPGTDYSWISSLGYQDKVEILAVEVVDHVVWGRFYGGWISLQYTDFDESKLEQYRNHKYGAWYTKENSTCVTHGQERRDCAYCDDYEARELELTDHRYGQWYEILAATCVEPGQERRDCAVCGYYELQDTAFVGHVLGEWYVSLESTCVDAGEERRDCRECDYFETRATEPAGHTMGQWYVTVEPAYGQEGQERRDCDYCDYFETRALEASEHDFGQWYAVTEPTCTEEGLDQRDCALCGYSEIRVVEPLGHDFTQWEDLQAPNCTESGLQTRTCVVCEITETQEVSATGHAFTQWETVQQATCTKTGQQKRSCQVCSLTETQKLDALGHSMGDWYVVTEPGCTTRGRESRDCERCNYSEVKSTSAKGHSMQEWHTVVEPTCTATGKAQRECANCTRVETKTLSKLEHSYCDWYITVEPTYERPGQERRDCENCGAYEVREKKFDGQVITKVYATITVSSLNIRSGPGSSYSLVGYVVYGSVYEVFEQKTVSGKVWGRIDKGWICLTGYTTLKEVVEVIGHTHSFGDWYDLIAATCTESGRQRRDCDCGHYETRTVNAVGHNFGAWYTVREATAEEKGQERRDCAKCGHFETRETEYQVETVTKIYGTLTGNSYLNIRAGAGVGYALVGKLYRGDRVEIFEIVPVGNTEWGRIAQGWIQLTGYMTLEEVQEPVEHAHDMGAWNVLGAATCTTDGQKVRICRICGYSETETIPATGHSFGDWYTVRQATASENGLERRDCANCDHFEERETQYQGSTTKRVYATIICSFLNVRSGPGSNYSWVATVAYGTVHEVYEQVSVGGKVWGRIDLGWICLTGNATLEEVEESTEHTHTMGDWYTVTQATCTSDGQMRRDCSGCDYSETKTAAATGHSFGQWYVAINPTCTDKGEMRRDCATCGYSESRIVAATGHYMGEWYTVREATASENGLERRDCANCDHFEEREVAYEVTTVVKVYATITAYSLSIRSGPGSSNALLGYVKQGEVYEVYEQATASNGKVWGRIDKGWICLTGYTTLEEVVEEVEQNNATANTMKVTAAVLNVRAGAGSNYQVVTSLAYGTEVTVLETKTVNGVTWARIAEGWVSMTYLA